MLQELLGCPPVSFFDELGDGKLAGAINCHEEILLAFSGLHFRDIHMEEANGISFEPLAFRFVAADVRQTRDAVALKTPM